MRKHITEEVDALAFNLEIIVEKLQSGDLSVAGIFAAEELIKTLLKIKDFISDEENADNEVDAIISRLPLLYFQIPKLN